MPLLQEAQNTIHRVTDYVRPRIHEAYDVISPHVHKAIDASKPYVPSALTGGFFLTLGGNAFFWVHDAIMNIDSPSLSVDFNSTLYTGTAMVALGLPFIIKDAIKKQHISPVAVGLAGLGAALALVPEVAHVLKDFDNIEMGILGFILGTAVEGIREITRDPKDGISGKRKIGQSLLVGAGGAVALGIAFPDKIRLASEWVDAWRYVTNVTIPYKEAGAVLAGGAVGLISAAVGLIGTAIAWPESKKKI